VSATPALAASAKIWIPKRPGDTLVVAELSRMTRSLLNLLETTGVLEQRRINLISLRENIDTNTATGRCFLSMMGAIHQMERELRAERAASGRASAKPELRSWKCKKARRNGLFCSKRVAGGCLRSRNRLGVLQGACLGRSRFSDAVAAARTGDGHRGAHLAGQVIH
jgi:hypothetical protein